MNKNDRIRIKKSVLTALKNTPILKFPVNIKAITKSFSNVRLIKYSVCMTKYKLDYNEMLEYAGTEDAFTDYYYTKDQYLICYNDLDEKIMNSNRYRWNIAHELGHILLNHHKKNERSRLFRNQLSEREYMVLEDEANMFASYILVPHAVLSHFKITYASNIRLYCKISTQAAQLRIVDYRQWRKNSYFKSQYDYTVDDLFYDSLIADFKNNPYFSDKKTSKKAFCSNCGFMFHTRRKLNTMYCPICGRVSIKGTSRRINMAKYAGIKMSFDNRPEERPICSNDEIPENSNYCIICGSFILNVCQNTNCNEREELLPGNARYCPCCGGQTTFFKEGYLKAWNEKDSNESLNEQFTQISDDDIPF